MIWIFAVVAAIAFPGVSSAQLQVTSTAPALNATAAVNSQIIINFDRPLDTASVNASTFRVYGQWSGAGPGTYVFSNSDQTVTLIPSRPFSAGEAVFVNLSHDIRGTDLVTLPAPGYAYQFLTAVAVSPATFHEIDRFSNQTGAQTRIYGASAADLDNDGYLDLATINEVSGDVRVFMNRADGTGLYQPMLPPQDIGLEASPHQPADFNNDGLLDLCVSATTSQSVWILLGAGDGTFSSITEISVGGEPHGIAPLDVDGDGDLDVVNANVGSNNLALLINNGAGVFAAPTYFEGGVNGEYGLTAADMDGDHITDLVVGGRNGEQINTMLGNGNGTFTAAGTAQSSGGSTWVVVVGDVDGDLILDAVAANDGSGNIGVLIGQGDGTFAAPTTISIGSHVPSVDLGDLDGDGDLDMVVSSFGGGFWRWYRNDGTGAFTLEDEFEAPNSPSCAVLYDGDNDGDLDMALFDELADYVLLMQNGIAPPSPCSPAPTACRNVTEAKKSKLLMKDKGGAGDILVWNWTKGEATSKAEFGDPIATDTYTLCLYEGGELKQAFALRQACGTEPCWKDSPDGFSYKDADRSLDGVLKAKLMEGVQGAAKVKVKGKGDNLPLPALDQLTGVLEVQLQQTGSNVCWGATFTPPFKKVDPTFLKALSDDPASSTAPPPIWSAIHAQVVGPTCGGCHGGSGGLSGLADCNTGYANLVGVPSTELVSMNRVEPGAPGSSWLMHKLDGTQDWFDAMCGGMFCGSQMPLGGELPEDVRAAIRAWITNGAVNDCP